MKKNLLYITALLVIGIGSCKKILDRVDFNGVPDTVIWNDPNVANLYLNNLYNLVMPVWPCDESISTMPTPIHNISDDANGTSNNSTVILNGTLTVDQITDFYTGASGVYAKIRQINILLSSIDSGSIDIASRDQMKAQAYFLRAYCYFSLVKLYGGVPYITYPQDWLKDDLLVPRNKTSECVNMMLDDLNHCSILPAQWTNAADYGRITRGAALALKGKILLYWASPQFNPGNDASRWETAYQANRHAYDSLLLDGYALYPTFSRIFLDANKTTDREGILFRSYNGTTQSGLYNNYDAVTRPVSNGATNGGKTNNPTWNLVTAFPMKDGKAITDPTSAYTYDTAYFWHNRDPRFGATIVFNGAIYGLASAAGRKQWTYNGITDDKSAPTTTGFYCRKNIDTTLTGASVVNGKTTWVEMRLAEVMLNLAECANATGRQSEAYDMMTAIRKRAGIDKGADNMYGIPAALSTSDMVTAILLERRIEFAFEGKRYDDLRRTRTFDQLNGQYRNQLVVMPDTSQGITVKTLEITLPGGGKARDTINVEKEYSRYFKTVVKPITSELPINFLSNYYIYGIPTTNITKDPNMKQTLGWGTGDFDATQ